MDDYGGYEVSIMEQIQDEDWKELEHWLDRLEDKMNADRFKADPKMWEAQMNELETEGGTYLFPPKGYTKVRLLLAPEREIGQFYEPVLRSYQGKERLQHMMPVLVLNDQGFANEVKIMVVAKTVTQGILSILAQAEYDLLHPEAGHGITISRQGDGLKTKYSVMPTRDPVPVDYLTLNWYEGELASYARQMESNDREEPEEVLDDDDEIPF